MDSSNVMEKTQLVDKAGNKLPMFDWVDIPKGEFDAQTYRLDGNFDSERVKSATIKKDFKMSRFVVTNRQYECFVLDGGYENAEFWLDDSFSNYAFTRSRSPQPSRPKTEVSWYEAKAFCVWLTKKYQELDESLLKIGGESSVINLPSSDQWLRAAVENDLNADIFPWGEPTDQATITDQANIEGVVGQTSPINSFPKGNTSQGLSDLSGNVEEWCNDWYDDDQFVKVLHGGSWISVSRHARPRYRGSYRPGNQDFYVGFRVCLLPSDL